MYEPEKALFGQYGHAQYPAMSFVIQDPLFEINYDCEGSSTPFFVVIFFFARFFFPVKFLISPFTFFFI